MPPQRYFHLKSPPDPLLHPALVLVLETRVFSGLLPGWFPQSDHQVAPRLSLKLMTPEHAFSSPAGPYFQEPLKWKVTEDCQVLLTCKASLHPTSSSAISPVRHDL